MGVVCIYHSNTRGYTVGVVAEASAAAGGSASFVAEAAATAAGGGSSVCIASFRLAFLNANRVSAGEVVVVVWNILLSSANLDCLLRTFFPGLRRELSIERLFFLAGGGVVPDPVVSVGQIIGLATAINQTKQTHLVKHKSNCPLTST